MKIKSINKVQLDRGIQLYDVINATPHHNFLIKSNSSDNYIVSHNCGFLDEMDFNNGGSPIEGLSKMMSLYLTIKRRIESRYMKMGVVPGLLFLVSSKRSSNDFLETYIKSNKNNPHLLVSDEPIWIVKNTKGTYSGDKFKVAVGNRMIPSSIITKDTDELSAIDNGLQIIEVPVEHKPAFESDINSALRDIAGIALSSDLKYMNMDKYRLSVKPYLSNLFTKNIIELDFDDSIELKDYLIESKLPTNRSTPMAIHWDTSKSGDRTGLSMSTIVSNAKVDRVAGGSIYTEYDLVYRTLFSIGITSTKGKEIPFYKIRNFIYHLKFKLGFNIVSISSDTYNSLDTLQQFKLHGLDAKVISMDRTATPYNTFKNAINEGRWIVPDIPELEEEASDVYYDYDRNKVDHTPSGSKDMLDSVGGSIFALSEYKKLSVDYSEEDNDQLLSQLNNKLIEGEVDSGWLDNSGIRYFE